MKLLSLSLSQSDSSLCLALCCRPHVCILEPFLWPPKVSGVASAMGHTSQLWRVVFVKRVKTTRNERMWLWGSRCGRQRIVSPSLHVPKPPAAAAGLQASRPPLVTAKARFSVKHWVYDAWELTTDLGALTAQPDKNQLGPCTLAEKP